MKSIEELKAIRDRMQSQVNLRNDDKRVRVLVGMATCGISAGARPVLAAITEEVEKRGLKDVMVTQTGCIGICRMEPVVEIYEGETVAEKLMGELLSGPESRELRAVIPPEMAASSVRVDSGVCYVKFPAEALQMLPPEEERQQMILWSLADSLYSLRAVEEIRILADGQELDMFGAVPTHSVSARPQG